MVTLHLCNTYAGYVPFGSGCSPASPFQNILCFPFYMNFKTAAKIIFFIQPTLRCIGGLLEFLHSRRTVPIGEPSSMAVLAIGMITQLGISGTN